MVFRLVEKIFDNEVITGLKNRKKCGRHPELSDKTSYKIKTILRESNQGWTTKQIEELIIRESGIKYHYTHIYRIVKKWGFKQKVPRKVHVNTASKEEKDEFKKRPARFLWIYPPPRTERLCHSIFRRIFFFFYDSLVRRVWIVKEKRPVVRITSSHELSCLFGAVSMMDQKQLFRQYDKFNTETFLDFLKEIHHKFPVLSFHGQSTPPHYKSMRVKDYLKVNRDTLVPVYLPTASPEFMMLEEVWNIAKRDLLLLKYYSSFDEFKEKISLYFRTKKFGLNMRNYLLRTV